MVDTLVAFGCSHTSGYKSCVEKLTNVKDTVYYSYAYYLFQKLKFRNYENYARTGASNIEICSDLNNFIFNKQHLHHRCLVVVGWTGDNRFTIINKDRDDPYCNYIENKYDLKFKNVNAINPKALQSLNDIIRGIRKCTFESMFHIVSDLLDRFYYNTWLCTDNNAMLKYSAVTLLQRYNIQYITFPTILHRYHLLYDLLPPSNNIRLYTEGGNNINFDMLEKYKCFVSGHHMNQYGHEALSKYLFKYIIEQQLL